jgi:hypothetical protein
LDQGIGWAPNTFAASIQDVCVDHGRSHIGVARQFLHLTNVAVQVRSIPDSVSVIESREERRENPGQATLGEITRPGQDSASPA